MCWVCISRKSDVCLKIVDLCFFFFWYTTHQCVDDIVFELQNAFWLFLLAKFSYIRFKFTQIFKRREIMLWMGIEFRLIKPNDEIEKRECLFNLDKYIASVSDTLFQIFLFNIYEEYKVKIIWYIFPFISKQFHQK